MTWKPVKTVPLDKLIGAVNICSLLEADDLATIGNKVAEGYEQDIASRTDWERRQASANKLVLQVVEQRTDPWPNASNIKFPLVTVAAMQFQARAYPGLISGTDLVKVRVIGQDEKGEKTDRAERIATHMSWQCLEQDPSWEEDHDKLFLVTAIAGCGFIKSGFEPGPGRLQSQLVLPRHFVVNYWTRSLEDSPRYTHTFYLSANNIRQREIDGRFRELSTDDADEVGTKDTAPIRPEASAGEDEIQMAKDQRQGLTRPEQDDVTPWFTGEQYCWLDLDGDGYEEPYIVTFDIGSGTVRRIVARYLASGVKFKDHQSLTKFARPDSEDGVGYDIPKDAEVYKIAAVRVFTKYGFIPSPDGGFYDLGLGSLEGPINVSVNTIINMMVDAGTMKTLGGGFLGRGFKGKGGPITFAPGQWYPLDAPGDDIRKSMLPRPDPDPPPFLFQLLGLLIQYAERIVSANDIQSGEQDVQNQKAETTRILNENGSRVYNGIFKRFWRSFREEYRVRYELNALFLRADVDYEDLTTGRTALIRPDDYMGSSLDVRPAADPHIVSDAEAQKQATMLVQWGAQTPGANRYRINLRFLKAMKVPNAEELYPAPKDPQSGKELPDYPPPPNVKMMEVQVKQGKLEIEKGALQLKTQQFASEQMQAKIETQMELQESQARVILLQAQAAKAAAEAKGAEAEPAIKLIFAQIEAEGKHQDRMNARLLKLTDMIGSTMEMMNDRATANDGNQQQPGVAGAAPQSGAAPLPKANGGIPQAGMGAMGI